MKLDNGLEPFRAAIESLQRLLHKFNDRGVIIRGIAVGFLGSRALLLMSSPYFFSPHRILQNSLNLPMWKTSAHVFKMRKSSLGKPHFVVEARSHPNRY
jgi:hypothetical protein